MNRLFKERIQVKTKTKLEEFHIGSGFLKLTLFYVKRDELLISNLKRDRKKSHGRVAFDADG